jgi:hypothetical protein
MIYHALEIRRYAILPTLALASFYLAGRLIIRYERLTLKSKIGIGMFLVLLLWSHVYGAVILFCHLAYFLVIKYKENPSKDIFKAIFKYLTVIFVIAAPLWIYAVFGPHCDYGIRRVFEYIPNPLVDFIGFVKGIFGNLVGNKKLYFLLLGVFFPWIFSYRERYRQIGFLLITVIFPIEVILISDLWWRYWFIQRQFIWVMPFFALYLGWSWEAFFIYVGRLAREKRALQGTSRQKKRSNAC